MFVLGSKSSENTQKLYELCIKHCILTQNIESIDKLFLDKLPSDDIIGIVAGASTPDRMIREVLRVMSEQEKTTIETIEAAAPAEEVVVPQEPQMTEETAAVEATVEAAPEAAPKAEEETVEAKTEEKAEAEVVPAQKEKKAPKKTTEHDESSEFAEAFEATMTRIHNGQVLQGTVISIVDGEVFVNIVYKSDA